MAAKLLSIVREYPNHFLVPFLSILFFVAAVVAHHKEL